MLPQPRTPTLAGRALRQLVDPLSLLLIFAGIVSLVVLRDLPEGLAILLILLVNVVVGAGQEGRADRAVRALRDLTAPSAKVRRAGRLLQVPAAEVVPGDLIELAAGDRVPADAELVVAASLGVEESALTGEAATADKSVPGRTGTDVLIGDRTGEVFAGTLVVRGSGTAVVTRTGGESEVGRIAATLRSRPKAPLELELGRVSVRLGLVAAGAGVIMILVGLARVGRGEGQIVDVLVAGVALAIAAVPESLVAAVTSALAVGAQQMARLGVIVRKLPAIEALGATTVIATDKTGTLTTGELAVVDAVELPDADLWPAALRCNDASNGVGDAVDVALMDRATELGYAADPRSRLATRPFDAVSRSMAVVHPGPLLTVKGAPEVILDRCREGADTDRLRAEFGRLAQEGLRVLAFASGQTDQLDADGLRPLGLVAMSDQLRPSAAASVADCRAAGTRVIMVTGDHADTARAVAREVGIDTEVVVTGADLGTNRDDLLRRADVVARVDPETKLELVRVLRRDGEVVTMTGDGVNDAPALRHADVGVALAGVAGTDVAREAAAVVVTNGELSTIVSGIRAGRRLYHNVTSMIGYLLSGNFSEVALVLAGLVLWPDLVLPLLPVHLLWVNLVTDGIPALALGVDQPAGDPLRERPRRPGQQLLNGRRVIALMARGVIAAALVVVAGEIARRLGWSDEQVRTQVVLALVYAHLSFAYVARARRWTFEAGWWRGRALRRAVLAAFLIQSVIVLVPWLGQWLSLVPLPPLGWALALGAGVLTPVLCDAVRLITDRPRTDRAEAS